MKIICAGRASLCKSHEIHHAHGIDYHHMHQRHGAGTPDYSSMSISLIKFSCMNSVRVALIPV
jgi:hypothetical protein